MSAPPDSPQYLQRKAAFDRCLTVYGRNVTLEALGCPDVVCERLHLADSNRPATVLDEILRRARAQGAEIRHHSRTALSRISRNAREDQGVAADIRWPGYRRLGEFLLDPPPRGGTLLAVDGITNPQNLGMLIRSGAAGGVTGILLPRQGACAVGPLVIKASAGSVFRAPLLRCEALPDALDQLRTRGWRISVLDAGGSVALHALPAEQARVFVLGAETAGPSADASARADERVRIPLANGVESLNVAVAAALVAYRHRQ